MLRPVDLGHIAEIRHGRIVTSGTRRLHAAVIHSLHNKRSGAAMTQRTFVARHSCRRSRRNMTGRFGRDAGIAAAMTGLARSGRDAGVIEFHRQPTTETCMTIFATQKSRQVSRRLHIDIRKSSTVAICAAGRGDAGMRVRRDERQPGQTGPVTYVARLGGCNMRRRLSRGIHVIVAGSARAGHHACMRETGGVPCHGGMADIARLRGGDMRRAFRLSIDSSIGAAMAGYAITCCYRSGCAGMAHDSGIKRREIGVAHIALGIGRNVIRRFAQGEGSVMTGGATAGNRRACRCMIKGGGCPTGG